MWIGIMVLLSQLVSSGFCQLGGWESLGCWRDLPTRAIASLEGKSKLLGDNWKQRTNPLNACAEAAKDEKLKVFAVQDGGQCFGGPYAHIFYDQYGPSNLCKGGVGGIWSSSVYSSKMAYTRVLESKKDNEKLVKCNKPLDMIFLVDGSGDSNVENKLRWDQMLKFVSKATEHFDSPSTRFGVISYGSQPSTIVNIHDNKDEISMRDSIISANFPGGPRTINEALKKAWKEQLKYTERGRNKVIVAMTASSMDYGPWGSSLFLTNRGVRLLSMGIDRAPSYRYLESLASGKHPENIYSIDSDQLDATLPYFAKDVCTGFKKNKMETVRKDKEIDFISSQDFETVGSVVERKYAKKGNKTSDSVNSMNEKDSEKHDKKVEIKEAKNKKENKTTHQITESEDKKENEQGNKGTKKENSSSKPDDLRNLMSIGSYQRTKEDDKINGETARKVFPINNSSLSDGDIVEKLKENAVEVLTNTETFVSPKNFSSLTSSGKPLIKEMSSKKNETKGELKALSGQVASSNYKGVNKLQRSQTGFHAHNATNKNSITSFEKIGNVQMHESHEWPQAKEVKIENSFSLNYKKEKSYKHRDASNKTLASASNKGVKKSGGKAEINKKPWAKDSSSHFIEGQSATRQKENFGDGTISEFNITAMTSSHSDKGKASHSNVIPESAKNSTKSGKKPNNESQNTSEEHHVSITRKDGEKDLDKETFDGLQQQRESIGQGENDNDDETMLNELKSGHDLENYSDDQKETSEYNFTGENVPDDEITIDEDERVTQTALEEKRREIDFLLKKLDETRRRRRRRKVRQRSKDSREEEAIENFSESDNENNVGRRTDEHNRERKEMENGMETGMKRRFHKHTYSDPQSRHLLLITQNDSKPFPVQRPFKTVPTAKAFKLLDKLYSSDNKSNMKLKYDIFDPAYSSKNSKVMTNSSYKKFKKLMHRKSHKVHGKAKIMSTNKYQKETSDKQQFFLRNGISSKVGQSQNSNIIGNGNQRGWRSENANKKHVIKRFQSKNMTRIENSKKTAIDIKKVLDQYYAYFIKQMQPFWIYDYRRPEMTNLKTNLNKHNQSLSDRNSLRRVESQNKTESNDSAINQPIAIIHNNSDGSSGHKNTTTSSKDMKNFILDLNHEQSKKNKDVSVNVVRGSKAVNATIFGIKPMSFKSLDSIDSGNYTVYRFSKNDILINVQSKTGELLTFYGKSPEKAKKKTKRKHRKHLLQDLSNNTVVGTIKKSLKVNVHRGDTAVKKHGHHTKIQPIKASRATNLVDNLKYFQSSLQEEPGIARGLSKAIVQQGKKRKITSNNSHAGSNSLDINSNLTAYDVYDNRLAHVERQRQYFGKNRPDPDRLVITENNDPDTDSRTVKLFVNAGDENSLMPTDSVGINSRKEEEAKNMLSGMSDEFPEKGKWNKQGNSFAEDDDSKYNILVKSGEETSEKTGRAITSSKEEATGREGSARQGLRKIVEEESNDKRKNDQEQIESNISQNVNRTVRNHREESNGMKAEDHNANRQESGANYESGEFRDSGRGNTDKDVQTVRPTNPSSNHKKNFRQQDAKGDRKESTNDEVWIFRPDHNKDNYKENNSTNFEINNNETKYNGAGLSNSSLEGKTKSENIQSQSKEEPISNEGLFFSRINQDLGCTKPVTVLYAIDVSDAIGTGPTRQRKWNHMKRFLHSVNEKVIHGGSMGYIVYDTEPRFLSNLEPCDEKTEYFVTSGECLCDRKAASFREGKSSCSTHAPTEDESVEDWGKEGPRTAKALNYAESILKNETLGDSKKLVVLVTHEASTDDVTGAERSLKENSISLVDIEIGERHNIEKRSNRFDDVIPRDHQMEVSFYKLDKAIENIFTKICREKDPTKTRRSKIFARLRKHKNWW